MLPLLLRSARYGRTIAWCARFGRSCRGHFRDDSMARCRIGVLGVAAAVAVGIWVQPALGACGSWQKVAGPPVHGSLSGVSALSTTDAWAVGTSRLETLAERWNGSVWKRVPTPNPGGRHDWLRVVVSISPNDAWAVGGFGDGPNFASSGPLLLHWNGSVWHRRLIPVEARHASFADIAATSTHDVWIVGRSIGARPRALHYNGSRWTVSPAVNPPLGGELDAVAATSSSDAWAMGYENTVGHTVAEHWDGHAWHPKRFTSHPSIPPPSPPPPRQTPGRSVKAG